MAGLTLGHSPALGAAGELAGPALARSLALRKKLIYERRAGLAGTVFTPFSAFFSAALTIMRNHQISARRRRRTQV